MTTRAWHVRGTRAARRAVGGICVALALLVCGTASLQDVAANGDTRSLQLYHEHTKETLSVTYRQGGRYVPESLRQLNWFLRDWRIDEQTEMDPKLFDIVWQVYREARADGPIHVASAYRSPETNASLRRRSRGVAEHSQHMRGKAMDFFLDGVSMARVREIGMRLQHGGVGFYPHSRHQFVHLDAGGVRSWPRMPDAQLARLFPDGRTVHIPKSGEPMAGYEEAKATILARGGTVAGYSTYAEGGPKKGFWAALFGGGEDEDEDLVAPPARTRVASAGGEGGFGGLFSLFGSRPAPAAPAPGPVDPASARDNGVAAAAAAAVPNGAVPVSAPLVSAPLPPRRPAELAGLVRGVQPSARLAAAAPVAIAAPERRGEARPTPRSPAAGMGIDEKAALKSLFESAADPRLRTSFSSTRLDAPPAAAFSGPAVARLQKR